MRAYQSCGLSKANPDHKAVTNNISQNNVTSKAVCAMNFEIHVFKHTLFRNNPNK